MPFEVFGPSLAKALLQRDSMLYRKSKPVFAFVSTKF